MFTALHHFTPAEVERILDSARRDRVPFAAFEATHRSVKGVLVTPLVPLLALLLAARCPAREGTGVEAYAWLAGASRPRLH